MWIRNCDNCAEQEWLDVHAQNTHRLISSQTFKRIGCLEWDPIPVMWMFQCLCACDNWEICAWLVLVKSKSKYLRWSNLVVKPNQNIIRIILVKFLKMIRFGRETKPKYYPMLVEFLKVIRFGRETKPNSLCCFSYHFNLVVKSKEIF